jgi:hypothetical protein
MKLLPVMLSLGHDPQLTEMDTHHHSLRNLEVFQENFALTAVFPFLKKHGVKVPFAPIREKFEIQAGWEKVIFQLLSGAPLTYLVLLASRCCRAREETRRKGEMDQQVD